MNPDPWLQRWLPLVRERAGASPVLELGCGSGADSATLAAAGLQVIGLDLSVDEIQRARSRVPTAEFHCQDIRAPFPAQAAGLGVVLASLSLHYFSWPDTEALVARIGAVLRPGGVLLCRLNSTEDVHHGARGHPRLTGHDEEPFAQHYYSVDGEAKRFFDRAAVEALFADGWRVLSLEQRVIHKYAQPKALWEAILEREE
ncbi:MAG: class I SAM-dependent methyltransferase [Pseudomonadota bacterium]